MTIDTLKYAKTLEARGVPAEQAEAHAFALEEAVGDIADIRHAVQGLERSVDTLRGAVLKLTEDTTALKTSMSTLNADIKWLKWFQGATMGLMFAAGIKYLLFA